MNYSLLLLLLLLLYTTHLLVIISHDAYEGRRSGAKPVFDVCTSVYVCTYETSTREWTETASAAVAAAADVQRETLAAAAAGHTDSYVDWSGRAGCAIVDDARVEFARYVVCMTVVVVICRFC